MRYIAKKMGEMAFKVPDAIFETWDGKIVRASAEQCWAVGHDIKDVLGWAERNGWMLKIASTETVPPVLADTSVTVIRKVATTR